MVLGLVCQVIRYGSGPARGLAGRPGAFSWAAARGSAGRQAWRWCDWMAAWLFPRDSACPPAEDDDDE